MKLLQHILWIWPIVIAGSWARTIGQVKPRKERVLPSTLRLTKNPTQQSSSYDNRSFRTRNSTIAFSEAMHIGCSFEKENGTIQKAKAETFGCSSDPTDSVRSIGCVIPSKHQYYQQQHSQEQLASITTTFLYASDQTDSWNNVEAYKEQQLLPLNTDASMSRLFGPFPLATMGNVTQQLSKATKSATPAIGLSLLTCFIAWQLISIIRNDWFTTLFSSLPIKDLISSLKALPFTLSIQAIRTWPIHSWLTMITSPMEIGKVLFYYVIQDPWAGWTKLCTILHPVLVATLWNRVWSTVWDTIPWSWYPFTSRSSSAPAKDTHNSQLPTVVIESGLGRWGRTAMKLTVSLLKSMGKRLIQTVLQRKLQHLFWVVGIPMLMDVLSPIRAR